MNSLSHRQFPIKFKPQEDELFSSWFSRLALAHGLSGNMLANLMWRDKTLGSKERDFDRLFDKKIFEEISEKTGITTEQILNTSLFSYTGYLFSEAPANGITSWIMPSWSTLTKKFHGMQFCWQCLKEDVNPYFRRKWRLSFIVNCTKHKIALNDRCPKCDEPINCFWTPPNIRAMPIYICKLCDFDLRNVMFKTQPERPSSFEIEFQTHLENVLKEGWVENLIGATYSHLYFDGIYLIMRSLCGKLGKRFCELVADFYKIDRLPSELFNSVKSLEMRSIKERRFLNILVGHLIANWHQDFVKLCEDNKIRFNELVTFQSNNFPFWYWKVINEHILRPYYTCSELEINSFYKYVKSQGELLNTVKIRKQFGYMYYKHLIMKKKLISYKKLESRECIYCHDTENQKRAPTQGNRPANNYRYYCKICKRAYTPNPLPRRSTYSQETRKAAIKLIEEGLDYSKIAEMLSVSRTAIRYWHKNSL